MEVISKGSKKKGVSAYVLFGTICIMMLILFLSVDDLLIKVLAVYMGIYFALLLTNELLFLPKESKVIILLRKILNFLLSVMFLTIIGVPVIGTQLSILLVIVMIQVMLLYGASLIFQFGFTLGQIQMYFICLVSLIVFSYWGKYSFVYCKIKVQQVAT